MKTPTIASVPTPLVFGDPATLAALRTYEAWNDVQVRKMFVVEAEIEFDTDSDDDDEDWSDWSLHRRTYTFEVVAGTPVEAQDRVRDYLESQPFEDDGDYDDIETSVIDWWLIESDENPPLLIRHHG